jgi:hypothetical protein
MPRLLTPDGELISRLDDFDVVDSAGTVLQSLTSAYPAGSS